LRGFFAGRFSRLVTRYLFALGQFGFRFFIGDVAENLDAPRILLGGEYAVFVIDG